MKRNKGYTDVPLGRIQMVEDFLPPPEQLVLKEDGVKITIFLSQKSVDFFKTYARKAKIPYQRMIRRLLDEYAGRYSARNARR